MREADFRHYLENAEEINSKDKAVNSRVSKANTAERILGESLDFIVSNDGKMYQALLMLKAATEERGGNLQNALRWYYKFANDKDFPRLSDYKK